MAASQKIDDVYYPAPLRLVADTPHEIRWSNSPTRSVFSFPWKSEWPSSSDGDALMLCDYYEDGSSSSEASLSSRRDPEDSGNITLQCLLDYCTKIGVHARENRAPKNNCRNLSELIEEYVTLKARKDFGGPSDALPAASESRTLATKICRRLQSIDSVNISKHRAGNAVIPDELARQIYLDTVPPEYMAARDLTKHLDRRAVFV